MASIPIPATATIGALDGGGSDDAGIRMEVGTAAQQHDATREVGARLHEAEDIPVTRGEC